jgi:hypothetical protein
VPLQASQFTSVPGFFIIGHALWLQVSPISASALHNISFRRNSGG